MSGKLVYIDSIEQALNKAYGEGNPLRIGRVLNNVSAVDAVEVVRCRYCKHFIGGKAIGKCYLNPDKPIIPVFYNHFCSYGERRKG